MAYTPGPWFVLTGNVITNIVGPGSANHIVADVRTDEDARLIREAPELLEACELFVGILDTLQNAGILSQLEAINGESDDVIFVREQARATIARAKGG